MRTPIKDIMCATSAIKDKNKDLVQHIRKWAVQFNVSHGCANEMLNIQRSTGIEVSKDIQTILLEYIKYSTTMFKIKKKIIS